MAVRLYKSTDTGAPVLSGSVGSLITVLDAVLVNGYNAGVTPAAGWTKAFSGTNQAAYRNSATGGTGFYVSVDDTGPNTVLGARKARLRGFETMTAVTTGTGGFPTSVQIPAAIQVYKSITADATARAWTILADQRTFYLFTDPGGGDEINGYSAFMFGDVFSLKTGDAYRCAIIGRTAEPAYVGGESGAEERMQDVALLSAVNTGHYLARSYQGVTQQAIQFGKHNTNNALRGLVPYPNPTDQSILLAQLGIHELIGAQSALRGRLRGIWDFQHDPMAKVNDGDTFPGTGPFAGKTFQFLKPLGGIGTIRLLVLETSDTWETSA